MKRSFSAVDAPPPPERLTNKTIRERIQTIGDVHELEGWDVSGVTNMSELFSVRNTPLFSNAQNPVPDLSRWDVSNVTTMERMFKDCKVVPDITMWNVSSVRNMSGMFINATTFNQPLGRWNVANVRDMSSLFKKCSAFNQPLQRWNVSDVVDASFMFAGCSSFDQPLHTWRWNYLSNMEAMFLRCTAFNQPLDDWGQSLLGVQNMNGVFAGCTHFNQPLERWNVSNVFTMRGMFDHCTSFNQPLERWSVHRVQNFEGMFRSSNYQQPLVGWKLAPDPRHERDMKDMFRGYHYWYILDCVRAWDVDIRTLGHIPFTTQIRRMLSGEALPPPRIHPRPFEPDLRADVYDVTEQTHSPLSSLLFHPDGSPQEVFLLMVKRPNTPTYYDPIVFRKQLYLDKIINPFRTMTEGDFQTTLLGEDEHLPPFLNLLMTAPSIDIDDMVESPLYLNLNFASTTPDFAVPTQWISDYCQQPGMTVLYETHRIQEPLITFHQLYFSSRKAHFYNIPQFQLCVPPPPIAALPPPPPPTTLPPPPPSTIEVVVRNGERVVFEETTTVGEMANHFVGDNNPTNNTPVLKFICKGIMFWVKGSGQVVRMRQVPLTNTFREVEDVTSKTLLAFGHDLWEGQQLRTLDITLLRTQRAAGRSRKRTIPSATIHSHKRCTAGK